MCENKNKDFREELKSCTCEETIKLSVEDVILVKLDRLIKAKE